MNRWVSTALLAGIAAVATGCPVATGNTVTSVNIARGAVLGPGAPIEVQADGRCVVSIDFGPRTIMHVADAPDFVARFSADEFPEGIGTATVTIAGTGSSRTFADVHIDRTAPEFIRPVRVYVNGPVFEVLVWDNIMFASASLNVGGRQETWAPPRARATTALLSGGFNVNQIPEGSYEAQLTLTDAAGNVSMFTPKVVLDRTRPTATIVSPVSGAHISGVMTLSTFASDELSPVSVELRASGSFIGTANASGTTEIDTQFFPKGALELEARARDAAGNLGAPAVVTVIVD